MGRKFVKEEILELKWRCEVPDRFTGEPCGHENRGSSVMCEKCFHPRPEGEDIFYLPDDARAVTDADELEKALKGPDWKCMSCGYDNKHSELHCHHCGELRKEDEEQWLEMGGDRKSVRYGAGRIPTSAEEALRRRQGKGSGADPNLYKHTRSRNAFKPVAMKGLAAAAVILVVVLAWFFFFKTTRGEFQVSGFFWERQIAIERAKKVIEEDWSMPKGGKKISLEKKVHHYDQVVDGYKEVPVPVYKDVKVGNETYECGSETLANGFVRKKYCERPKYERRQVRTDYKKEPVYKKVPVQRNWYTYEVERWFIDRTRRASAQDQKPYWPKYQLGSKERVGKKSEQYMVNLSAVKPDGKFKTISYAMDETSWKRIQKGQKFIAELTTLGAVKQLTAP